MDKITKISAQKKDNARVNIFVNEEYFCALQAETMLKNHLQKGMEISKDELLEMQKESDYLVAINKASNLLSKNLKTEKQIRDYLKGKGYDPSIVSLALAKLKEYNLINDNAYACAYVSSHKGYGEAKLKSELFAKGVSKKIVEEYFEGYEEDIEQIQALVNKYLKNKERTDKNIIKAKKYIISKGYSYDVLSKLNYGGESGNENWNWYCWVQKNK